MKKAQVIEMINKAESVEDIAMLEMEMRFEQWLNDEELNEVLEIASDRKLAMHEEKAIEIWKKLGLTEKGQYVKILNELVDIEMSEGSHTDSIEDYATPLDFYLSNAMSSTYYEYVKNYTEEEHGLSLDDSILVELTVDVEKEIHNKVRDL